MMQCVSNYWFDDVKKRSNLGMGGGRHLLELTSVRMILQLPAWMKIVPLPLLRHLNGCGIGARPPLSKLGK